MLINTHLSLSLSPLYEILVAAKLLVLLVPSFHLQVDLKFGG